MPTTLGIDYETIHQPDSMPYAVTADGGVSLVNPSPDGGMWAFRITNVYGEPLIQARGVILPRDIPPLTTVSNNVTETIALLIGLEYFSPGMKVLARTDSLNAIRVFREPQKDRPHLPDEILSRCRAVVKRLGAIRFELLAGHPTKAIVDRLNAGEKVTNGKYPYCVHNNWCHHQHPKSWADYLAQGGK